jgi:crossover junction endodeoxyribonuclease RusA
MLTFEVPGLPQSQGSTSSFLNPKTGKIVTTSANPNLKQWRAKAKVIAKAERRGARTIEGAVAVHLTFRFPRPLSHYSTGRGTAGQLRPSAPKYMLTRPDIDKVTRACLDALTAAGVYLDDNRVVELHVDKEYAHDVSGAVAKVGAYFLVMELEPAEKSQLAA